MDEDKLEEAGIDPFLIETRLKLWVTLSLQAAIIVCFGVPFLDLVIGIDLVGFETAVWMLAFGIISHTTKAVKDPAEIL